MSNQRGQDRESNRIKAVSSAFNIIESLRELKQAGVSRLADHLEIPKSTAHVYLKTLEEEGYVINRDGTYRLSLRFLELGGETRQHLDIYQAARQEIDSLSTETGEVANLGIEEQGKRVLLYTSESVEGMFDNSPTGEYTHIHWTALGKALLAQLPDDRVGAVVDRHGLPRATENTITDREELFDELEEIRGRGYSIEDEEHRKGIKAIAAMPDDGDNLDQRFAVAISGPKRRIGEPEIDPNLLKALRDAVNVIELKYKHY